ncbi:hypothetical protein CQ12_00285 [Bradyrhizobium jicamae]|uniref:Uncharacterized protein n=1 Tax=Bradyrhizobium jicamae TaxID=280332 RepID=A0A0R3LQF5_9BRAD|nr:hypothetical protein CQ12_00285 [Bradyrhizobium jicamae]
MLLSRPVISGAVFALLGVYFAGAGTWLAVLGGVRGKRPRSMVLMPRLLIPTLLSVYLLMRSMVGWKAVRRLHHRLPIT